MSKTWPKHSFGTVSSEKSASFLANLAIAEISARGHFSSLDLAKITRCTVSLKSHNRNQTMAEAETQQWVSDQLHQILGLSDKYVAQYLVGLAKKATSVPELYSRLENTGTIKVNDEVRQFAAELWDKVPHKNVAEKPGRAKERAAIKEQQRIKNYKLVSDPEEESLTVPVTEERKKKKSHDRKRKHIRTDKTSKWESDEEEELKEDDRSKRKKDDSSSDEWEKAEEERMKDLEERDALAERIKKRDKEHTRKIAERSDKKVQLLRNNVLRPNYSYCLRTTGL